MRRWVLIGGATIVLCGALMLYRLVERDSRIAWGQAGKEYKNTNVVLVLWPERIELRQLDDARTLIPRPEDAKYSFTIPKNREKWVQERISDFAYGEVGWFINVARIGPDRQRIEIDRIGHHRMGLIYEATRDGIVPVEVRRHDPIFAFVVFGWWLVPVLFFLLWSAWRPSARSTALPHRDFEIKGNLF